MLIKGILAVLSALLLAGCLEDTSGGSGGSQASCIASQSITVPQDVDVNDVTGEITEVQEIVTPDGDRSVTVIGCNLAIAGDSDNDTQTTNTAEDNDVVNTDEVVEDLDIDQAD